MNREELLKKLDSIIEIGIVNAREDKAVLEAVREELKKPVMVITAGSYSDYHIVGVSLDRDTAERINLATYDSNPIEAYVPIEWAEGNLENEAFLRVDWNHDENQIERAEVVPYQDKPRAGFNSFYFFVSVRSREARDALTNGKDSDLLKKVAQDKYAEYLAAEEEKRYKMFGGT